MRKTPAQVVNEFEEQVEIEKEKAKERNKVTAGEDPSTETFPDTVKGEARDEAAEKINADVSGRSIEKGQKVKEIAEGETDKNYFVQEIAIFCMFFNLNRCPFMYGSIII